MVWLLEAAIVPLFLGALALYSAAQPYAQFTSGVNLVEVYATVIDRDGEPVTGLTAADFHVAEDGAGQTISAFAAGEFPLSVAIGLDRSFSMGGVENRLAVAKSAARTLIGALRPADQVPVAEFVQRVDDPGTGPDVDASAHDRGTRVEPRRRCP